MSTIKEALSVFRNGSREKTSELYGVKILSEKEKNFFFVVFDTAVNSLSNIINGFNATKELSEKDFIWLMQIYTSQCARELYDISKKIEDNPKSQAAQNIVDVKRPVLIEHLEVIIGGEDIKKYLKLSIESIESFDGDAKNSDQLLLSKTAIPLILLKENNVDLQFITNEELLKIAKNNYENSMQNFLKLCIE